MKDKEVLFYNEVHTQPEVLVMDNLAPEQNIEALYYALLQGTEISAEEVAQQLAEEALLPVPEIKEYNKTKVSDAKWVLIDNQTAYEPHRFNENDDLFVQMYFVSVWNKEWGGETIIFNNCEAVEVASCVPTRVIIAEGNHWMRIAQPTKDAKLPIYVLQFKLV